MSEDCRTKFIDTVKVRLLGTIGVENTQKVLDVLYLSLQDYELENRCTDVVVRHEDINQNILANYHACLVIDGKSEKTIEVYIREVQNLAETLGKPFTEMGEMDIRYYLADKLSNNVSGRTLENSRSYITALFNWMCDHDIIEKNPCKNIKPIKYADEIRDEFSDVDIDKLRSSCKNKKERALIEFLLATGVRVSELSEMDVSDVNFDEKRVLVLHGKGNKQRYTLINDVALNHLVGYISSRKEGVDGPLFYNKNHERISKSGIEFMIKNIANRVGVDNAHPHRFRRTFATNLAKNGMPVQSVQKLMGHTNISTTMQYVNTSSKQIEMEYRKYA